MVWTMWVTSLHRTSLEKLPVLSLFGFNTANTSGARLLAGPNHGSQLVLILFVISEAKLFKKIKNIVNHFFKKITLTVN